jgi:GTPase SAR1 family protein
MLRKKDDQITVFAETNFRGQNKKFGILKDDRRRHMYIVGKTGMGKTTLMEQLVVSDINNGNGFCIVDPHGEFADKMLNYIPNNRVNDVIYFNPGDADWPIAFNVMENNNPEYKHLISSGLVGVFKKIWADSWGPRLEYVLRNTILALLDYQGSTLLGTMRMLTDQKFRSKVIKQVKDPVVKAFWVDEFSKYPDKFASEAIAPIQNKIGQFLSISLIRNIVGQPKSTINVREVMDNKKILILNLSKGKIGEDASALFGAMMVTHLQLAAMSRVDISEEERADFYLYVDEFQNFATDSFADILSEARKYRLNLIMAHQYIGQLEVGGSTKVRDAVFGNVGTIVTFRIGGTDSEFLAKEFEPVFEENDLVNLSKYNVYLKLMINGVASQAFSARTISPEWEKEGNREKIIKVSRERYAKKREIVEEKIARWSGMSDESDQLLDEKSYNNLPGRGRSNNRDSFKSSSNTEEYRQPFKKLLGDLMVQKKRETQKDNPKKNDRKPNEKQLRDLKPNKYKNETIEQKNKNLNPGNVVKLD